MYVYRLHVQYSNMVHMISQQNMALCKLAHLDADIDLLNVYIRSLIQLKAKECVSVAGGCRS